MDVSVVIVNYNTRTLLEQCLHSVFEQTTDIDFEVIVVDNASQDDSLAMLRNTFSQVVVVPSKENIGFGRANNLGISIARGKYVFMLNSDTIIRNNAAKLFFEYMEDRGNVDVGAVGSVMFDTQYKPNYSNSFNRFFTLGRVLQDSFFSIIGYKRNYAKVEQLLKNEHQLPVDFIVGADLFSPKQVLDKIGGFDPRFFLYYEETDMQLRMKELNLRRMIISGPDIVHLEGGSSSKHMSFEKYKIYAKSMFVYFRKNRPFVEVLLLQWYVLLVSFLKFLKSLFLFRPNITQLKEIYLVVTKR